MTCLALLAHDNATLASAALDLLAVAAPSFGRQMMNMPRQIASSIST